jgi:hypothetical protein
MTSHIDRSSRLPEIERNGTLGDFLVEWTQVAIQLQRLLQLQIIKAENE